MGSSSSPWPLLCSRKYLRHTSWKTARQSVLSRKYHVWCSSSTKLLAAKLRVCPTVPASSNASSSDRDHSPPLLDGDYERQQRDGYRPVTARGRAGALQGESPRRHGDQDAKHGGGEGDGGEHEAPGEAAEVAGALGGGAHQDVHRGQQQAQQVEGQGEQRRQDGQIHGRLAAEGLGHGQQQDQQELRGGGQKKRKN
ncbi:hypothetical protein EYF80_024207 [Liparis tanakae]|uniref:Uncharacterized protein n=1 Tax=Liparis tanakae TaxID=230148 RepID=A0A4Z2HHZ4_9TELE|nr:hypothetical protein EYF80_024207 [Liparis tanakae]